jgi:membrane protease YdiL (CAAX protease family)
MAADSVSPDSASPLVIAAAVAGGMIAAWFWVATAPELAMALPAQSQTTLAALYYGLLFIPLIALAGLLGLLCRTAVFRLGAAPGSWLPVGLLLGGGGLGASALAASVAGVMTPGEGAAFSLPTALAGAALILLQVSGEEVFSRGWMQTALTGWLGPFAGIAFASILFAVLHLAGGPVAWHSLANMILAGVVFGLFAWRSGGLVAPIAAHFAWNAVEDLGLGLVPNPGQGPFGALRDFELAGPALWGGGSDGLNASVATTLALLVIAGGLLAYRRKRAPSI